MVKVKEDLTGKIFHRLTVKRQAEDYISPTGRHLARWICECSCDNKTEIIVLGSKLKNGNTQSCGCLQKERAAKAVSKRCHKVNKYDLSGNYGIGWTSNTNKEFYFDLEDYDKIKDYCWSEDIQRDSFSCLKARIPNENKIMRMHVFLGFSGYDHINRNELDNRKENLRKATHQQNSCNRSLRKDNTSGVTGVYFDKTNNNWYASITIFGKHIKLGTFANKEDAIKARLNAEVKYFKEFAPQSELYEEYNINKER